MERMMSVALLLLFLGSGATSESIGNLILEGAKIQIGKVKWDDRYPGGYLPIEGKGVCTDVVVAAFKYAGIDLQDLVHEDVQINPGAYKYATGDKVIDHRRARVLMEFFERHAKRLSPHRNFEPGDLLLYSLAENGIADHIAIVSDRTRGRKVLIIDNYPDPGYVSESRTFDFNGYCQPIAHYRFKAR